MLTPEQNDLVCRSGPGTPLGKLFRQYWLPITLERDILDDRPFPVQILHQHYVLFRDEKKRIGMLDMFCTHRGADLSYGRLEDGGLRCLYHGWKFGVDGAVQLDMVQSVEDVTGEVLVDQNKQYVIGKRESTNYVTAKSGEVIVLGGFRKNANLKSTSRLGPIPIIGDLLGSRTKGNTMQELIFFLRPTVLTNSPAVDNVEVGRAHV